MPDNRKLRVFLCHSSQDKPIVRELYQRLNAEGWIDPWLDEEKLLPGQDWDLEIEKAVESTDAVIVFLSNNSVTKEGYIQKELRKVLDVAEEKPEGIIFIIPLRLDDCLVPHRLKSWQYENFFPRERAIDSYKRIIGSLTLRAKALEINITKPEVISDSDVNDSLLSDAIFLARTNGTITTSLLQRKLRIGYTRTERLIAKMVEQGIISQSNKRPPTWQVIIV
jgi:DNA segregation ATPase FtsK/SpoIIIE-like protein